MRGRARHRLEKLEQALRPKGGVFFMWDDSRHAGYDGPDLETRLAAYRAENGLQPQDEIFTLSWLAPLASSQTGAQHEAPTTAASA